MPRVSAVVTVETNDTRYALLKVGRDGIWGSFLDEELCPGLHAPIGGESRDPFRRLPAQEGCAAPSAHLHLEGRIAEVLLDAAQRAMDFAKFREDQLVGLFRPMDGGLSAWGGDGVRPSPGQATWRRPSPPCVRFRRNKKRGPERKVPGPHFEPFRAYCFPANMNATSPKAKTRPSMVTLASCRRANTL